MPSALAITIPVEVFRPDDDCRQSRLSKYFLKDAPVPEPWMTAFVERAGNFNVIVDPKRRRSGIGIKLLGEGVTRWHLDFERQNYTREGAELVRRFLTMRAKA